MDTGQDRAQRTFRPRRHMPMEIAAALSPVRGSRVVLVDRVTEHYGHYAWSEPRDTTDHTGRVHQVVDVVPEVDWWRHVLLGQQPPDGHVKAWPVATVHVE